MSQPALSKAVKILEDEVGLRLTIPSGRGIAITDEGRRLFERAMPLVAEVLALKENLRAPKSTKTTVRIGSFEVFTTYLLGHIVATELSTLALTAFELIPGQIEDALLRDKIDFGVTYAPVAAPGIEFIAVGQLTMGIFGRPVWQAFRLETGQPVVELRRVPAHVFKRLTSGRPRFTPALAGLRQRLIRPGFIFDPDRQPVGFAGPIRLFD